MNSLEVDAFVPSEDPQTEETDSPAPLPSTKEELSNSQEKGYRPATCPLTRNDSKSHADFVAKERAEKTPPVFRKGDKPQKRSFVRSFPRPHSSVLPHSGTSSPRAVSSLTQPLQNARGHPQFLTSPITENERASTTSMPLDLSRIRTDTATYCPAGDSSSFTDSQNLESETWQRNADPSARSPCGGSAAGPASPPPLPTAAAGEAAPGASNAYAVPHWVELAWEERPDVFWDCIEHFFSHGVWPQFHQQPESLVDLCEVQQLDPEAPSNGLRGFAPIWIFLLKEDDERVFRAAVDFYFECGRFPEWNFMTPSFVTMCEGMGIGEFDFYE